MAKRQTRQVLLALVAIGSGADAFKFMSNWKPPKVISESQKVNLARTEERFGDKKLVVVTGCSSGLGRETVKNLLATDEYHVIGAVRSVDKMAAVAEVSVWRVECTFSRKLGSYILDRLPTLAQADGLNMDNFHIMDCELNSFESVHQFCAELEKYKLEKPIDRLICNAGVYKPSLSDPEWSMDGHEQTMQVNFLSHFLMISKLLDGMKEAPNPRVIMVGSATGNDNTVGGGGVYPIADLKQLEGFKAGFDKPIAMADGYGFVGAKAYEDSKLALEMASNTLHKKFHRSHGVSFSSIYPGCIAETPSFGEGFRTYTYFPIMMEHITGGHVSVEEAGQRLFQVAHDPRCGKSGVSWSWKGGPREGRGAAAPEKGEQIGAGGGGDSIHTNDPSDEANDPELGVALFQTATEITGAEWPIAKTFQSPCPTLHVISAVSKNMIAREELKRMAERPGSNEDGTRVKLTKRKRLALIADKVIVQGLLGNTVGRVGKVAGRLLLGRIPETAKSGSFQEEKASDDVTAVSDAAEEDVPPASEAQTTPVVEEASKYIDIIHEGDKALIENRLEDEIFDQVFAKADGDLSKGRERSETQKELSQV